MNTWALVGVSALIGIGLGALILTRTNYYKVRKYAIDMKKVFDRHKVQEKAEAVQAMGQNPNPVLVRKPLKELVDTYKGLIADLEKIKVPKKAREVHEETLTMHRESMNLYQMALLGGGVRQKVMVEKQRKLQQMERSLNEKMEKLYGKPKK